MAKKTVMIVDDSKTILTQLSLILRKCDVDCVQAECAEDALSVLQTGKVVDLMLLDVNMPGMTGIDLLRQLDVHTNKNSPQVVILTTESDESMITEARTLGARGWLIKPFSQERVLGLVAKLLKI